MKVVTVGTSYITRSVINSFKNNGIEVFACIGRDLQRVKSFAEELSVGLYTDNYDNAIQSDAFDFVYIGIPNRYHYEYAKKALENGKNVIVEKPMCSNFKQASELVKLALKNKLLIFENNKVFHNLAFKEIEKDISKIGNIKSVQLNFSNHSLSYDKFLKDEDQTTLSIENCSGALMDVNVYNVSFATSLFGLPKQSLYLANKTNNVDTSGVALLKYDNFIVTCNGSCDSYCQDYVYIQADKGYIKFNNHCSIMNRYEICVDGVSEIKEFDFSDKFKDTFMDYLSMSDVEQNKKYEKYLKYSLMEMKILDALRKSANIIYPGD